MAKAQQPPKSSPRQQMAPPPATALAKRQKDLAALIESRRGAFAAVAARQFDVLRMVKLAQVALSRTPEIAECSPESVLAILIRCSELGLEPGALTGGMHLVPRKNKKTDRKELTGVIDYRAYVNMGKRNGAILSARARVVHVNDEWRHWEDEEGIHFLWEPAEKPGDIRGFFGVVELAGEGDKIQFDYMSLAEVTAIKARANPQGASPWLDAANFIEMGKKTVIRRVMKLVPNAGEPQRAAALEERTEAIEPGEVDLSLLELGEKPAGGTAEKVAEALGAGGQAAPGPGGVPSQEEWRGELDKEAGEPDGTPPPDEPGTRG